jgi:hypothetical protein
LQTVRSAVFTTELCEQIYGASPEGPNVTSVPGSWGVTPFWEHPQNALVTSSTGRSNLLVCVLSRILESPQLIVAFPRFNDFKTNCN